MHYYLETDNVEYVPAKLLKNRHAAVLYNPKYVLYCFGSSKIFNGSGQDYPKKLRINSHKIKAVIRKKRNAFTRCEECCMPGRIKNALGN